MSAVLDQERPATPAALVRVDGNRSGVRALKSTLEELDDEDLVAIARIVEGNTPHRRLGVLAVLGAGVACATLAPVSAVGAGAVVVAGLVAFYAGARRQAARDLYDLGLSQELAAEVGRAAGDAGNAITWDKLKIIPHLVMPRSELLKIGRKVVDRVRLTRDSEQV